MQSVAILAITKHGISTGLRLLDANPEWSLYAPEKFAGAHTDREGVRWYADATSAKIAELFAKYEGLVCIFSLGATIRLVAPHMKSKKTDPAVVVVDESSSFAISVLSGHIGGANELTESIAGRLGAQAVITTAADVKRTIAVDMIGRDRGWVIEDDSAVTAASAHMVNEERVGIYQDAGDADWHGDKPLPANVTVYDTLGDLRGSDSRAHLIISDRVDAAMAASVVAVVVYRPPSLTVGVGLHYDTASDTIQGGIKKTFEKYNLATKSISRIASIRKPADVPGLQEAADAMGVPLVLYDRDELSEIDVPNPSGVVQRFEGTPSVSEAACIRAAGGGDNGSDGGGGSPQLVVEKQKFPPDLTIAVARHRRRPQQQQQQGGGAP